MHENETYPVNPLVRRTDGERAAYTDGYLAALRFALDTFERRAATATSIEMTIRAQISATEAARAFAR